MKEIAPCGFHINFSHIEEKNENKKSEQTTDETFLNYESTNTIIA